MTTLNKILISSLAAMMLGAAGTVVADDTDTHKMHTKAMKEAGHKDGEPMANKAPEAPKSEPAPAEEHKGKKHRLHNKAMKESGHKDGEPMGDANPADNAAPRKGDEAKDDDKDTHKVHNKAMKEAGHKDGDPMKN